MKLIIDINEDDYNFVKRQVADGITNSLKICITNGTPIPKGHGDLIDRNEIEYLKAIHDLKWGRITAIECAKKIKYSAPTIIEADTEESEE